MTIGEKISRIRKHRSITQKQLGEFLGFGGKVVDRRISHYETGFRVPKKETLIKIADFFEVEVNNFIPEEMHGFSEEFFKELLWLDEEYPNFFNIFCFKNSVMNADKINREFFPGKFSPVSLCVNNDVFNEYLKEWYLRIEELRLKEITREEYFEWKINWPKTSVQVSTDFKEVSKPSLEWRRKNEVGNSGKTVRCE